MTGFVKKEIYDLNKIFKVELETSSSFPEGDRRVSLFQDSNLKKKAHAACAIVFMEVIKAYFLDSSKRGLTGPEIATLNKTLVSAFQELKTRFGYGYKEAVLFFREVHFDSNYDRSNGGIDIFAKYTVIFKVIDIEELPSFDKIATVKHSHRIQTRGAETALDQFSTDAGDLTSQDRESLLNDTNTFVLSGDQTGSFPDFTAGSSASGGYSIQSGVESARTK
jgi:hypothetical protein